MRVVLALRICLLLAAVLLPQASLPAADGELPLAEIIARVVARDEATQRELAGMSYEQRTRTEQMDGSGRVTHYREVRMSVSPGASPEIKVVSVRGDEIATDPDEAAGQAKGEESDRRKHNFSLKTLVSRFDVSLAGREEWMGQPAYVLAFEPKRDQPYRDQTERVLNQLHGRMWVAERSGVVLKTEASLMEPVAVAWIFARVTALRFEYELRSATSEFGPAWIEVMVEVDTPVFSFRQRQRVEMDHFEPRRVGP